MLIVRRHVAVDTVFLGLLLAFTLFATIGVADLVHDYSVGGNRWQQGDWLINSLSGLVRRGTIGTGIILLSDALAVSPLAVTVGLQIVLVMCLMAALFALGMTVFTRPSQIVALLLPPFYPVMMVSRFDGMIYKDVIAILALAILTIAVVRPEQSRRLVPLGALTLVFGCFGHEALVFFFPVAAYLILLTGRTRFNFTAIALLALGTASAFVFALIYSKADPDAICAELMARNLNGVLCEGPISWLNASVAHAISTTAAEGNFVNLAEYAFVWGLSVLALAYLLGRASGKAAILACLTLLPFLPLFVIAFDFGRWFSFGFSSLVFILLAQRGFESRPFQGPVALVALGASSIVTYDSTAGIYFSGLVNRALALAL